MTLGQEFYLARLFLLNILFDSFCIGFLSIITYNENSILNSKVHKAYYKFPVIHLIY